MLQIRNITRTFKSGDEKIVALNNVSIDFPDTGLIFIVGKSGAGKSTLLNILGGLDIMDEGEVYFDGESTKNYTSKDFDNLRNYKIGFIFQEFNLLDDVSVYDNIAISLKMQAKGHDVTTIDEALKLVNLEGLGYRKISELSGGQKQRIAIARALVKNPNIILADEPTGALDSKTGFELMASLKTLSEKKLVIVVSHDYDMAYYYADKIIFLNDGKITNIKNRLVKRKEDNITTYGNCILKISSGNKFDNPDVFNKLLHPEHDNCICITSIPENITIAHPEEYDEIFKVEDYKLQFVDTNYQNLKEIKSSKETIKSNKKKAKLKFSECLKMAFNSYKKSIGRIIFLLLFTIISISLLGTCLSLAITSTEKVIANTLINNDISLGIMQKKDTQEFNENDLIILNDKYSNTSFAMGKTIDIAFGQSINANNSPFAMGKFTGIVECDDISSLNLKIIEGTGTFNENSIENLEIIISDYAAYELQRTGYYGNNINGYYSINKPRNNKEIIGTSILLRQQNYKIIGIFDTNYENYLSLLVDSTYNNNASTSDETDASSLEILKNYYYSKIIAPKGFYKNMYYTNSTAAEKELYSVYSRTVEVYDAANNDYAISKKNISYSNFTDFSTFNNTNCSIVYEKSDNYLKHTLETGGLKNNQIVINSDLLSQNGIDISSSEQIERFIDTLSTLYVAKIDGNLNPINTVYQGLFEVVAIVHFNDSVLEKIFFSNDMVNTLESTKFNFNQMLFSLNGTLYSYEHLIKKLNEDYVVINIDGTSSISNASSINSIKTISLIVSGIFMIFSFLIILNFVSNNVKTRKKEIGILRANGARKKDILNIFVIEEGILALVISLASIVIVYNLSNILNSIYGNISIGIQLIVFDFIIVLIILFTTLLLISLATIIPVLQIASLKPIDAIRNN